MERYTRIAAAASKDHLSILGGFHPAPSDAAPAGCRTLLLLGPGEPGFWPHFCAGPEARDGRADPMDRWSVRVMSHLAREFGATAVFPFGGPPWAPFISWAKRTGRAWDSPVSLLVHDTAGLMVSYRGALALPEHIDLPAPPGQSPCADCTQPCRSACPVGALTPSGYDTEACRDYLGTSDGAATCRDQGCAVRRICPVSQDHGRDPAQSAFHMRSFHP